jgi:hypothetical protein
MQLQLRLTDSPQRGDHRSAAVCGASEGFQPRIDAASTMMLRYSDPLHDLYISQVDIQRMPSCNGTHAARLRPQPLFTRLGPYLQTRQPYILSRIIVRVICKCSVSDAPFALHAA